MAKPIRKYDVLREKWQPNDKLTLVNCHYFNDHIVAGMMIASGYLPNECVTVTNIDQQRSISLKLPEDIVKKKGMQVIRCQEKIPIVKNNG